MEMHSPPHPGRIVRQECLEPLGLSVTEVADGLGIGRPALSNVLNGQAAISPVMALRLEAAGWGVAAGWLNMQTAYDLWQAKQQHGGQLAGVRRFSAPEPA